MPSLFKVCLDRLVSPNNKHGQQLSFCSKGDGDELRHFSFVLYLLQFGFVLLSCWISSGSLGSSGAVHSWELLGGHQGRVAMGLQILLSVLPSLQGHSLHFRETCKLMTSHAKPEHIRPVTLGAAFIFLYLLHAPIHMAACTRTDAGVAK